MSIIELGKITEVALDSYVVKCYDLNFLVRSGDEIEHSYIHATDAEGYEYLLNTYSSFNLSELSELGEECENPFDTICGEIPMFVTELATKDDVLTTVGDMSNLHTATIGVDTKWFDCGDSHSEEYFSYFIENNLTNAVFLNR